MRRKYFMSMIAVSVVCLAACNQTELQVGSSSDGAVVAAQDPEAGPEGSILAIQDKETPAERDARMAWWREARFGMFIHWGLYAVPAGVWKGEPSPEVGEWIMYKTQIPVADYKELAARFNPGKFDARAWVSLAKNAGMKYIIITAKHHDGFAMFDSKADPFNIVKATPFARDPLRELAEEAHRQGIKLGFYYSQDQDWTAPGGGAWDGKHWDGAQKGDFAGYFRRKVIPQLEELLSGYSPSPAVIWFDTPSKNMTAQLASEVVALTNRHPGLIWNNRLGGGYQGDTETPEQVVPPQGFPGRDWETCMTMNNTWGYKSTDLNFKSAQDLLRNLVDIASKGGNYLLNVGPDAQGVIPEPEAERLLEMGKWLEVNGESVYGTSASPFSDDHTVPSNTKKDDKGNPLRTPVWDWRATRRPGKVYIHLLTWPGNTFRLEQADIEAKAAYLLADPKRVPLAMARNGKALEIRLPDRPLDSLDTVVVIETVQK